MSKPKHKATHAVHCDQCCAMLGFLNSDGSGPTPDVCQKVRYVDPDCRVVENLASLFGPKKPVKE